MTHYGEMLRRHVLQDTEVADLARRLYRRHRRAFDVVFEHRPDRQSDVIASCARFVEAEGRLLTEYTTRDSLGFAVATWDQAIPKVGVDWVTSGRVCVFEFKCYTDRLVLKLVIGPAHDQELRQRLFGAAWRETPLFRPSQRNKIGAKWQTIWSLEFIRGEALVDGDMAAIEEAIRTHWTPFLETTLPALEEVILASARSGTSDSHTEHVTTEVVTPAQ